MHFNQALAHKVQGEIIIQPTPPGEEDTDETTILDQSNAKTVQIQGIPNQTSVGQKLVTLLDLSGFSFKFLCSGIWLVKDSRRKQIN